MKVQEQIGTRKNLRRQAVSDLLRESTVGPPRMNAVHVLMIEHAHPHAQHEGGGVHAGEDPEFASQGFGIDFSHQIQKSQHPVDLVAVLARDDDKGR